MNTTPKHMLISSIAAARNFNWENGKLQSTSFPKIVLESDHDIAKHLLGQTATYNTLSTTDSIIGFIIKLPSYNQLIAEAVKLGATLPDQSRIAEYQIGSSAWFRKIINHSI